MIIYYFELTNKISKPFSKKLNVRNSSFLVSSSFITCNIKEIKDKKDLF